MDKHKCCSGHALPIFPIVVLAIGVLWLLSELGTIALDLPWLPLIVVVLALGMIVKFYHFKDMCKK
tara:strand:- start:812 stop:1009 length:198 start_codon:yes stop_codon:yes gene_type:complete